MHKYLTLFFSVSLLLCACKNDKPPGGLIKPDAMAGLLTEIHIIDGHLYSGLQTPDTLYKYGMGNYLAAFERFHTDSGTFKRSMNYYAKYPDKLTDIYDKVDERIKALADSVNKLQAINRKAELKADSIKMAHKADSIKKAVHKAIKPVNKADSIKKAANKLDSIKKAMKKADFLKKLKQKHPDALPKK
ncbi:DUF4296 domain-containing protein [Mucilaginibacter sp. SG564]|uniref:DUF4296 domain-containing protein n=1 Tax=unclassified Mucilaginibacter TaxID=2617802 RepID=UPI001557ECBD|nr:DUF4296 domain-containing protein [Mucilaginibacter sp. SG564]NOW95166.1 hypothetical protein [Mucilaginibacter sp. SG564]